MAEEFLKLLLDNLNSLLLWEVGLIIGVEEEMRKLSSVLTTIQAVLGDAGTKRWESKAVRDWLRKLDDLTYEIDDILDECATEVMKSKHKKSKLSRYGLKKILYRHKIGRRMVKATNKLDPIAAEREKFHLREMGIERKSKYAATRETGSILNEPQRAYGRDKEKEEIVDILVNQVKDYEQLSVLPIFGIGGLGKTFLAQLVVVEHFEMKIWVCVSDNFDLKTLIKAMIESATGNGSASDLMYLDALQSRLRELLNQKRYLLVLDDVWEDDQEKWDMFKNTVACGSKGATIVLTTRLKKVADIMKTLTAHSLEGLSHEHCWSLFKERAFGQEEEEHSNLEPIGKQIVNKCGSVPLAAKALGGLLRFKRDKKDWVHIQHSEIWNLQPEETLLLPALQLSYHHLPLELRHCFAYCAVFPKDTKIYKEELILCGIAHGYISSDEMLDEEDIGNTIWNELVLRSLFQEVKTNYKGTTFTMHDLVHDLAQSVMENKVPKVQAQYNNKSTSKSKIRQVNLQKHHVAFPARFQSEMDLSSSLLNLSSLRMLDASRTSMTKLPSAVRKLKHLRYLNLSSTNIRTLPSAICSLWNLKILNLNYCHRLVGLPKRTRCLQNLRHVLLDGCRSLNEMPSKIGKLRSLKTLSQFVVGHGKGNQPGELQFLNLGGRLLIHHLERVENFMDTKTANLCEKENLRELRLKWEGKNTSKLLENMDEKVLEALEPHPNIETIGIDGFSGSYFPQWLRNSSLVNLVTFELENCPNCQNLPQLGELPRLKILVLRNLGGEYILEDGGQGMAKFSSLEELTLNCLPCLKGFAEEMAIDQMFPCLQKLGIYKCPGLTSLPHLCKLQILWIWECPELERKYEKEIGEDWHKIAHIPHVRIGR
ncbi:putative disease resistance protein RGA3 [Primulina huaijiensis]|uniref:putative disease resistance protein RGA3 n=1 Tax=Primulina huaijiensis TaxID=1492673 RepID=UPI003CC71F36